MTVKADKYSAPRPGVRPSRDDHEWLTRFARREDTSPQAVVARALRFFRYWNTKGKKTLREALEVINLLGCEYQKQVRRQRYLERDNQMLSRRLHDMRRAYEKQLWQERSIQRRYERQLRQERSMRRAYEKRLQGQQSHDEQKEGTTTQSSRDVPYGPMVAKLLALAVCSESDGEAKAAFEKARQHHRLAV